MNRFGVLIMLLVLGRLFSGEPETPDVPKRELSPSVSGALEKDYPSIKVIAIKLEKDVVRIEASDALNEKFSLTFSADGKLLTQSERKLTMKDLPKKVPSEKLRGMKWEDSVVSEKEPTDNWLVYKLTAELGGQRKWFEFSSDGLLLAYYSRDLTRDQAGKQRKLQSAQKSNDDVKVNDKPEK